MNFKIFTEQQSLTIYISNVKETEIIIVIFKSIHFNIHDLIIMQ